MSKKQKHLNREELRAKLQPRKIKEHEIAGLGTVRLQAPSFEQLNELRERCAEDDTKFRLQLAMASCVDLTQEDWAELSINNNGFNVSRLVVGVINSLETIDDDKVGK